MSTMTYTPPGATQLTLTQLAEAAGMATLKGIADAAGVSYKTAKTWLHDGHLPPPAHYCKGSYLWYWDEVEDWAKEVGRDLR